MARKLGFHNETIDLYLEMEGLSSKECFAIGIGQLAWYRSREINRKGDLLDSMKEQWGFDFENKETDRERALFGMKHLWSQGLVEQLLQNPKYIGQVSVKDAVAYDSAQFASFINQIRTLELIDSEEAWGMLFLNAQRVQDCFSSWSDFSSAYTHGYLLNESLSTTNDSQLDKLQKQLMGDPKFSEQCEQLHQAEWPKNPIFDEFKVLPLVAPETPYKE